MIGATEVGGSALLMWVPAAAMTAVFWSNLHGRGTPTAAVARPEPVAASLTTTSE